MPTYDYECTECGHRFEKFQQMTASPVKTCPECRGKVKRLIGAGAAVMFKGSGFYATDYKNKSCGGSNGKTPPCADGKCPHAE
ncbi:MAG: FmdB family zinc ribbon protein [Phycisphaerae bacterium]